MKQEQNPEKVLLGRLVDKTNLGLVMAVGAAQAERFNIFTPGPPWNLVRTTPHLWQARVDIGRGLK